MGRVKATTAHSCKSQCSYTRDWRSLFWKVHVTKRVEGQNLYILPVFSLRLPCALYSLCWVAVLYPFNPITFWKKLFPVVSETAGSQRGMRGRGKGATARSCTCKWIKWYMYLRDWMVYAHRLETYNLCTHVQQAVSERVTLLLWVRVLGAREGWGEGGR